MRVLAVLVLIITLVALGALGFAYYGATMEVVAVYPTLTPADQAGEAFDELKRQIDNQSFLGTLYDKNKEILEASGYVFLTLSVRIENRGLLPQDYIQIEVKPNPGDILQLAEERTPTLAARTRSDFSATILTSDGGNTNRELSITYYVMGRKFETKVAY